MTYRHCYSNVQSINNQNIGDNRKRRTKNQQKLSVNSPCSSRNGSFIVIVVVVYVLCVFAVLNWLYACTQVYLFSVALHKFMSNIYWPRHSVNGSILILSLVFVFGLGSGSSKSLSSSANSGGVWFGDADDKNPCNDDLNGNPLMAISTPTASKSSIGKLICFSPLLGLINRSLFIWRKWKTRTKRNGNRKSNS